MSEFILKFMCVKIDVRYIFLEHIYKIRIGMHKILIFNLARERYDTISSWHEINFCQLLLHIKEVTSFVIRCQEVQECSDAYHNCLRP